MADDDKTSESKGDEEGTGTSSDPTPEVPTEKELKEDVEEGGKVTLDHLKELRDELKREIAHTRRDDQADKDEKAQLKADLERITEAVAKLTERLEHEGEKPDDSTIVVPPSELDPVTNPTGGEEGHADDDDATPEERKRRKWKDLW